MTLSLTGLFLPEEVLTMPQLLAEQSNSFLTGLFSQEQESILTLLSRNEFGETFKGESNQTTKSQEVGQCQNSHSQDSDSRVILTAILGHVPNLGPEYIEKGVI